MMKPKKTGGVPKLRITFLMIPATEAAQDVNSFVAPSTNAM